MIHRFVDSIVTEYMIIKPASTKKRISRRWSL